MSEEMEESLRALTPARLGLISSIIADGLATMDEYPPRFRIQYNARVEANLRNAHIIGAAKERLLEEAGIEIKDERGRIVFIIDGRLRLIFKKLNRKLRPQNAPTQQSLKLVGQPEWQLTIPGMPPPLLNVVGGYTLSRAGEPDKIYLTVPYGPQNIVELLLEDLSESKASETVIEMPQAAPAPKAKRAKPRKGFERKQESDGTAG